MASVPDRSTLRSQLAALDTRQQKIVGAKLPSMFQNPERVRDREWVVEQFTHVVLLAGDFEGVDSVSDGVDAVQSYAQEHRDLLLNACFGIFLVVADDLADAGAEERSIERAMQLALGYFAPG